MFQLFMFSPILKFALILNRNKILINRLTSNLLKDLRCSMWKSININDHVKCNVTL